MQLRILTYVTAILVVFATGWTARDWRADAQIARLDWLHGQRMKELSDKAAEAEREHRRQVGVWQASVAAMDEKHTKEMVDAKAERDALHARLRAGTQRLYVRATCPPAGGGGSAAAPGAARLDDGAARAELYREDAEALLAIAGEADDTARALTGLQQYVREVCLK